MSYKLVYNTVEIGILLNYQLHPLQIPPLKCLFHPVPIGSNSSVLMRLGTLLRRTLDGRLLVNHPPCHGLCTWEVRCSPYGPTGHWKR